MLIIWAVASVLWIAFSSYMFHLDRVAYAYQQENRYWRKAVEARTTRDYRRDYYQRAYERAERQVQQANRNIGLFFLVGIGFPGLMLAIGTIAMSHADKSTAKPLRKTSS